MNKETPTFCADRMKFIVATMTKDYEKAKEIANTMLKTEPENTTLQYYRSILEKETNKTGLNLTENQINDDDESGTESESEVSFDSNTDDSWNSDSSSDSEGESSSLLKRKKNDFVKSKKICKIGETKALVLNSCGAKNFQKSNNKYDPKINEAELRHNEFGGKIIRVLPIILSEKFNLTKGSDQAVYR